jgi:hypothetical protein
LPDPFTLAGDVGWTDYTVAADFSLGDSGSGTVMGRIDSADAFADGKALYPSGYVVEVRADGTWKILASSYNKPVEALASGKAELKHAQWHRLALSFKGNRISGALDNVPLGVVEDGTHLHGMFALGSGWNTVQFDNLAVDR